eukprot:CAMPEP_0180108878 /NCGR_PEP_ID=MMETSP0985-20121206/34138_1 /TAXON_ID=483367 /ORGANISM="non described non described, Strain CCMP 2436" /LENGTH=40 /DNA_ID= /DNA_START= /DNA_END= /DNA_ORIENTATION=
MISTGAAAQMPSAHGAADGHGRGETGGEALGLWAQALRAR